MVSTAKYFVPRMVGSFCARYPDIEVALEVLNRDGVVARLRDNMDDLYIMSMPPTDMALQDQVFRPNPLVVIAAKSHPARHSMALGLSMLKAEKFILREKGSGTRMSVDRHFKKNRFTPTVRMALGSNEAIKEAVAGGLGLSVISSHALGAKPQSQGLVVLNVRGFPLHSLWHLVCPKAKRLSPLALAFQTHLMQGASA
jgi:DNA-binding transcriptional LysR family regulator